MTNALLVAVGAALGAPARYLTDRWVQSIHEGVFPWGTFVVNVVGSLVIGLVVGGPAPHAVLTLVALGFCGGLSTWSTLAYDVLRLVEGRHRLLGVLNVAMSAVAGLGAAGLGLAIGVVLWS